MSEGLLDFLRLLAAGSLGALILFVLGWYKDIRAERLRRRSAYLQDQLRYLCGPLHFFMSQNRQLHEHGHKIWKEYEHHFEGKEWSAEAMKNVDGQADATIALANKFVQKLRENNARIVDIFQSQWYLIDDDDIEFCSTFQVHVIRDSVEFADNGAKDVPLPIILKLGKVRFYDPEWGNRIKQKWTAKREESSAFASAGRSSRDNPN